MKHGSNPQDMASTMGVPRTTASRYRKHTIFSRPYYDDNLRTWMPYASVVQDVSEDSNQYNFYYHEMTDLKQSFEREEQALCFGFIIGRCWIDEHLSHVAVNSKLLSMQLPDLAVRETSKIDPKF